MILETMTVGSSLSVLLPASLVKTLGINPGDSLEVTPTNDGVLVRRYDEKAAQTAPVQPTAQTIPAKPAGS